MTTQITFYVPTNSNSPTTGVFFIGSFVGGSTLTSTNYHELGLEPVLFPEQPEGRVRALATKTGSTWTGSWQLVTDLVLETEAKSQEVRRQRDKRLSASDWTQVGDAPVDKVAWAAYRQALRDVTNQPGFPSEVTWPQQPST